MADERSGALSIGGGLGSLAWHLGGLRRDTGDYEIPDGVLSNSSLEASNLTGGLSLVGESGYLGFAVSGYDNEYGIPAPDQDTEGEAPVRIDMDQRRFDVEGELDRHLAVFEGLRLRLGTTDYEHVELEGTETGTRFTNDAWELRVEAPHREIGRLGGGRSAFSSWAGISRRSAMRLSSRRPRPTPVPSLTSRSSTWAGSGSSSDRGTSAARSRPRWTTSRRSPSTPFPPRRA